LLPDKGPVGIGDAVTRYLARNGLDERLKQAGVIEEWAALVGPQIAQVTTPESIARDGTLFVRVATAAWAQELQMQTPMILERLRAGGRRIKKVVWKAG
jgi:predicted nucleic acid-binding Zn ribbon protein